MRTPTCAATGAARTRPARCCWPSAATTSTGSRTSSGARCEAVSSFGSLCQLRPEHRPEGAGERCLDCAIEPDCPYSARKIYLEPAEQGDTGWPVDVVAWPPTPEHVERALRDGPYGRCVWACDNDVVDHQVVSLAYEGGATASLTMTAFTKMRDRETRIFGTRGELRGNGEMVEVYDFLTRTTTRHEVPGGGALTGHARRRRRRDRRLRGGRGGGRPGARADDAAAHARVAPDRVRGRDLAPRGPDVAL